MDITKEMQDAYLRGEKQNQCPLCESKDVYSEGCDSIYVPDDGGPEVTEFRLGCMDCEATWNAVYQLIRIDDLTPANKVPVIDDADRAFTIEKLARNFSIILEAWLSPDQMKSLVVPGDDGTCDPDDFCDSNMALDAAFRIVMGRGTPMAPDPGEDPDGSIQKQKDDDTDLFNAAWDMAKANNFYYDAKKD